MKLSLAEIVNKTISFKKNSEKVEYLIANKSTPLMTILKIMYDKSIIVMVPQEAPPYTPSEAVGIEGMLFKEARRLRIFIKGTEYDSLHKIKRESLFISLLETVDPQDAKLLIKMIEQKRLTGLPISVIKEAYPGLILDTEETN